MRKLALLSSLYLLVFAAASPAQSCNPGEIRCFGSIEQRCDGGSAAQRPLSGESRGRWNSTGRSCSAGSSGNSTGASASNAQCQNGDKRCGADGYAQWCPYGSWVMTPGRERCDVRREETQSICTPGDQKCGPSGTVLVCEDANFRGKYVWRDTSRRCN